MPPDDPYVPPTSWCHDNDIITVTTTWNGTETQAQLTARHADMVTAGQAAQPRNC